MMSRETRLLLATIAISAVVVLILSTLRFPDLPRLTEAPAAPLERLAASAAYDQLARIVDRVARRVRPDLLVVRGGQTRAHAPVGLKDILGEPMGSDTARHYPALRIDNERAVVAAELPAGGTVMVSDTEVEAKLLAGDRLRQVTLLEVPPAESTSVSPLTLSQFQTPTYVVVAEGTAAGIAFRPVFVGSADRFTDSRWERPLLAVSGSALTSAGALVFSLEGQFIGAAVVPQSGTFAIAGAAELLAVATALVTDGTAAATDFGITVQRIDAQTARALPSDQGLIVVSVDPSGPTAGVLQPLDVITAIDGVKLTTPEDLLLRLARSNAGSVWTVSGFRDGAATQWSLTPKAKPATSPEAAWPQVERAGGGSSVMAVPPDTPAARAGLMVGDLIVRAGAVEAPTPAQLVPLFRSAADGRAILLIVRRDGVDRLITIAGDSADR
jgi:S1-C subfamily serine protease